MAVFSLNHYAVLINFRCVQECVSCLIACLYDQGLGTECELYAKFAVVTFFYYNTCLHLLCIFSSYTRSSEPQVEGDLFLVPAIRMLPLLTVRACL